MAKKKSKFARVMEPERAKDGDIVVLPAAERRLRLAPATWANLGLSTGRTVRSENSWMTVSRWLPKDGTGPRAFILLQTDHLHRESYEESLLGNSATGVRAPRDPELYAGSMVPLSVFCAGWTPGQAAAAVDSAYDDAVRKALARIGTKGLVAVEASASVPGSVPDATSTLIYDAKGEISGLTGDDGEWCASDRYPMGTGGPDEPVLSPEMVPLGLVANWYGHAKDERLRFHKGFLTNIVDRGGLVLRPDGAFVSQLAESLAAWWADEMSRRFRVRAEMDRRAAKAMAEAARRDAARTDAWSSLARGCRRRALALPSMIEGLEATA